MLDKLQGRENGKKRKSKSLHFFSLVELLITISILAILLALLLPALEKARGKARAITCTGNLKTLGQGKLLYSNDFDGWDVRFDNNYWWYQWYWSAALASYLGITAEVNGLFTKEADGKVYPFSRLCPEKAGIAPSETTKLYNLATYGINGSGNMLVISGWGRTYKYDKVTRASEKVHHTEGFNASDNTGVWNLTTNELKTPTQYLTGQGVHFIHSGRANVLFFDGHIQAMEWKKLGGSNTNYSRHWWNAHK